MNNGSITNMTKVEPWKGFKDFVVKKKVMENDDIFSLYLEPSDGSKVALPKAGQFIGIKIKTEDEAMKKVIRMYSLSMKPNEDYYRVSIKVVEGGKMTNYLLNNINEGDVLEVTAPKGAFVLNKEKTDKPLVLLGGGIGVTPVLSMLYDVVGTREDIHFVYSLRNMKAECFLEDIKKYKNEGLINGTIFFTRPLEGEVEGKDFDIKGRLTKEWMAENLPLNGDFYFCGNKGFTELVENSLLELGVEKENIHFEFF